MSLSLSHAVSLRPYTTLRTGGEAERFAKVTTRDELAGLVAQVHSEEQPLTVLGWGSNVLPSDDGVPGVTLINLSRTIRVFPDGQLVADSGVGLQDLFLRSAQSGLGGLEFAVGIPGTLGGALVSNAGAYRNCISTFIQRLEIVEEGSRRWVSPEWMEFEYRNSVLRRENAPRAVVIQVEFRLPQRDSKAIYDDAREFQRQRIGKQPASPSAGSFFKNVNDHDLAGRIPGLTEGMRKAGVVPAGFLIEAVGLKGFRHGGAALGQRHANFIVNIGGATATEIRQLAGIAFERVRTQFGVELEEEVLYLGDWSAFRPHFSQ